MTRTTRAAAMVAASVSVALLATACGSGGSGSDNPKKQKLTAHASDINPQPVSKLKDGGTVRVPLASWVTQHNYYQVDGSLADNMTMNQALMPDLWRFNSKGIPHANKEYLLSAEQKRVGSKQVITYNLNPKAKWSDGTPLSWKDFEALWKAVGTGNSKFPASTTTGYEDIEKVEKGSSDQQVKVTMNHPLIDYQLMFETLYPAKYMSTPEAFNKAYLNKIPATAGPFKVQSMDKGSQTVTLVRDPKWWGATPKLDKIIFRVMTSDASIDAFLNNEIDVAAVGTAEYYQRVKKDKKAAIHFGLPYDESEITFNSKGPLADVKVRQALQMAINVKQVAAIASKGMPIDYPVLGSHFAMPNQQGYQDNSGDYGKGNVKKTEALLKSAGYKKGSDGIYAKDGKKLSLSFVMGEGSSQSAYDRAEAMNGMWKAAGIQVKLNKVPANDFLTKTVPQGSFDITAFRWTSSTGFSNDSFGVYRKPQGKQFYQNYGRVGSDAIDAKFRQSMSAPSKAESIKATQETDKAIWAAGHSLPLFQTVQANATPKNLANFGSGGFQDTDWTTVGWMK